MTTLSHERGGVAKLHLGTRAKVRRLFDVARATPLADGRTAAQDPALRQRLARGLPRGRAAEAGVGPGDLGRAARTDARAGVEHREAGVERDRAAHRRGRGRGARTGRGTRARWGVDRVAVRSHTIAGGTTQVNKNIIAQRVLGLPRS